MTQRQSNQCLRPHNGTNSNLVSQRDKAHNVRYLKSVRTFVQILSILFYLFFIQGTSGRNREDGSS